MPVTDVCEFVMSTRTTANLREDSSQTRTLLTKNYDLFAQFSYQSA